ncbi:MAG: ASCH domain-containing protein [Lachnospiraceae bacterium]|nr:ASCH domain-containing protein [Lachnospiraceae bacterium]
MKIHNMNLTPSPMEMIREGKKTIELRLFDEKRKQISIGDIIIFTNTENNNDLLYVKVEDLYIFDSFEELYRKLPLSECGYTENDIDSASPHDMDVYYPKEKQRLHGVVGIKISTLKR